MTNLENRFIKELFKASDGLFAYTLYSRLLVSPSEIFKLISKLTNNGLIENVNDKLFLTEKGKDYAIKTKMKKKSTTSKFSFIPNEFLAPKMKINEFYVPNVNIFFEKNLDL